MLCDPNGKIAHDPCELCIPRTGSPRTHDRFRKLTAGNCCLWRRYPHNADSHQLDRRRETAVLLAGAGVNFLLSFAAYLTNGNSFFCQVNFLLGALNLLPFRYFDGGRILALLANGKVCELFRALFILLSAAAMVYMILHGTVSVSFAATFCFIVLSEVIY